MKNFPKLLLTTAGLFIMASPGLAATAPSYLAPANSFIYFESDTTQANPLKDQLSRLLREAIEEAENQDTLTTIADNIDNTTLAISTSFHQDGSEIYFFSIALDEQDFQTIIDELSAKDLTINNLGQDKIIYLTGDDFYFTYQNGNLLASNREGVVSDLLLIHNLDSINTTADWQFLKGKSSGREFLRGLINFNQMPTELLAEQESDLMITDLIQSEGFAVEQTATGYKGLITVKSGPSLQSYSTRSSFTPELFRKTPSSGLIFYTESSDWASNLKDTLDIIAKLSGELTTEELDNFYAGVQEEILNATGLKLESQIFPLFRQRTALALHAQSDLQYAPAFTLLSEVKGQETTAKTVLAALHEQLANSMEESFNSIYDQEIAYRDELATFFADDPGYQPSPLPDRETLRQKFFSTDSKTINGTTYTQVTFDPDASSYFYDDEYETNPLAVFTLSTAVTADGLMIVTTSKNLETLLSTNGGLGQDAEWQKNYSGGPLLEISFLNLINLKTYLQELVTGLDPENGATEIEPIVEFLNPLKSLMLKNTREDNYYLGYVFLNMDISATEDLAAGLIEFFEQYQNSLIYDGNTNWEQYQNFDFTEPSLFREYNFLDVDPNAWYSAYAYHLANLGIMKGYAGKEFRPGQNITRAEFIKTMIAARLKMLNQELPTNIIPIEGFSDVHSTDWFAPYINYAYNLEVIKDYGDGSFRPNQPITRAEAVTILIRTWEYDNWYFAEVKPLPFRDVSAGDWFHEALQKAYNLNLISGKTADTFAPADYLTRAETAAVISRYLSTVY